MAWGKPRDRHAPTRFVLVPVASMTAAATMNGAFTIAELSLLGPVEHVDVIRDGQRVEHWRIPAELRPFGS